MRYALGLFALWFGLALGLIIIQPDPREPQIPHDFHKTESK